MLTTVSPLLAGLHDQGCGGHICSRSTNATAPTQDATARPTPTRKLSIDPQAVEVLEKRLNLRPDKNDLIERNILKDDKVAPSLQAARDKLQRSQLEDKLDQALLQRPKREELIREGILESEASAPATA
ncbi:hypothetical protein BC629DRAFT_1124610 [Irpex lacteus]|nr:hypothetical protein BC629DRAFT_1124610 [Irpex lacteus]